MSGLRFKPLWVHSGVNSPWETTRWTLRTSQVTGSKGEILFRMENVEAPESWSQLAVDIAASKYFRRAGAGETSVRQLILRVVSAIANQGRGQKYFEDDVSARAFENDLAYLMIHQMAAFNSPVWFNCGLYQSYQVQGPGGSYHWNSKTQQIEPTSNAYEYPQCSACFIQSIEDDLGSIFDLLKSESRVFKYGSGSGTNFSKLRAVGEALASGGSTSGLMSFLEVFDRAAAATKSGGTTRRAAKMVCLDADHPEIEAFVNWKVREEKKAQALIKAGWSNDFNGEAYQTVSGQNSNNSVRVTDAFMKAAESGGEWPLKFRTTGKTSQIISASDLLEKMSHAAWACGDPGLQFEDTIQRWHTCPEEGPIRASNPCSEYMFLDDSACNLASLNLAKFLDPAGEVQVVELSHAVRTLIIAQDILVDFSSYPVKKIAENSHRFRPLGLGFANLGAVFMKKGLAYASPGARKLASELTAFIQGTAVQTSIELANHMGPFEGLTKNQDSTKRVLKQHASAAQALSQQTSQSPSRLGQVTFGLWSGIQKDLANKPLQIRNAQLTAIAPTGTIGLLMDCDTMGIEPEYALVKQKKLAGGGSVQILNQSLQTSLTKLGYSKTTSQNIETHLLVGKSLRTCKELRAEHIEIFKTAQSRFTDETITPEDHLAMMAAVQPFVSGALSKTVNLPYEATPADIKRIFVWAWTHGLKSISVYRDGSKWSQPLTSKSPFENSHPPCPVCGRPTLLDGGCFRCSECGTSVSCSS